MTVPRIVRRALLALVLLALLVSAVLLACGVLPYRVYVIHTGSMSPTIPPKSAVIVREGSYHVGQVISYQTGSGIVTHRLVARRANGMLGTKGDANRTADPSFIRQSAVVGGVVAAPRMAGYWLVYFKNPAGLASLFLAVICAWLVYSLPGDFARLKKSDTARSGLLLTATAMSPPAMPSPRRTSAAAAHGSAAQDDPVILKCSRCGLTFRTGQELKAHVSDFALPKDPPPGLLPATLTLPADYVPRSLLQRVT